MSHQAAGTVEGVEFRGEERKARGRNSWFAPRRACVQRFEARRTVAVSVESARPYAEMPPIYLHLDLDDARRLHDALGRQITALEAATPRCLSGKDGNR